MKKRLILIVCILALLLTGCQVLDLLRSQPERTVKAGWETVGESGDDLTRVYFMRYSSPKNLALELRTSDLYEQIPSRGYAVLYDGRHGFDDSYACFFDSDGHLEVTFDYEESSRLADIYYEDGAYAKALHHLENCNFIGGMINDAHDVCVEGLPGNPEKNTWYRLSDSQLAWLTGE